MSSVSTNQTIASQTPIIPNNFGEKEIYYPESDGKPLGETGKHIRLIAELIQTLSAFYQNNDDAYIIGDILMYYEEGSPRKFIVPDVFVTFGIGNAERRIYKVWEEEKAPDIIFEISSKSTWREDLQKKYDLYQDLGVSEYYIFDPDYDYLPIALIGHNLVDGKYEEMELVNDRISSPLMNLEIVDTGETLRIFDPETEKFLPTHQELMSESEELATKAEELESENKRLKAELAKLKKQN